MDRDSEDFAPLDLKAIDALLSAKKREWAVDALSRGVAMVHFDPRNPHAAVPARFRDQPALALNFAYGFRSPAFCCDEEGIGAVLSFNLEKFNCWVPWEAVFLIAEPEQKNRAKIWPWSVPPELTQTEVGPADAAPDPKPAGPRPAMSVLRGGKSEEAEAAPEPSAPDEPPPKAPPKRGHLRVVK